MPCSYLMQVRINIPPKKEKFRGLRTRYGVILSVANKVFILVLYILKCCYYEIQRSSPVYSWKTMSQYNYGILTLQKVDLLR